MKKILSGILALLVFVTLLAGCSGGSTSSEGASNAGAASNGGDATSEVEMPETDGLPDTDLGGYEFVIAQADMYGEGDRPKEEIGYSDINDAYLERNKAIEDRFNCKIITDYYNPVSFFEDVSMSLMAGDKVADILIPTQFTIGKFINADLLMDIRSTTYLKLDQPYWIKSIEEMCKVGSTSYGAANEMLRIEGHAIAMYFNKNLIQKLNLKNPYELVEQDQWNWDEFETMLDAATKDEDNNGTWDENDMWGMTGSTQQSIEALFVTSGNKIIGYTDASATIPQYTLASTESINTLTKLKDMFQSPGSFYNPNLDYNLQMDLFMKGQVLFFADNIYHYDYIRDMSDDYGMVPLPKGPNMTDYVSLTSHNAGVICIPNTIEDEKTTSLILEALAFASYPEREIWLDHVQTMFWRDEESREMADKYVLPSTYGDISYLWHVMSPEIAQATSIALSFPIVVDRTQEPATAVAQYADLSQAFLDETYAR